MWHTKLSALRGFLIGLVLLVSGCASAQDLSLLEFANSLKDTITSRNTTAFRQLPCFPTECIAADEVEYVFGAHGSDSYLIKLLKSPNVRIKVFGPVRYSNAEVTDVYVVVYFDSQLVAFDEAGQMSQEDRKDLWWNGYVETLVTKYNDEWAFYRTPFYFGAHLPWADDY